MSKWFIVYMIVAVSFFGYVCYDAFTKESKLAKHNSEPFPPIDFFVVRQDTMIVFNPTSNDSIYLVIQQLKSKNKNN